MLDPIIDQRYFSIVSEISFFTTVMDSLTHSKPSCPFVPFLYTGEMGRKRTATSEEPVRDGALKRLEEFVAKLESMWQRNHLEWVFDLLTLVRLFVRSASEKNPDPDQLEILRNELSDFIKKRRFLKDLGFVVHYVDIVRKGDGS